MTNDLHWTKRGYEQVAYCGSIVSNNNLYFIGFEYYPPPTPSEEYRWPKDLSDPIERMFFFLLKYWNQ